MVHEISVKHQVAKKDLENASQWIPPHVHGLVNRTRQRRMRQIDHQFQWFVCQTSRSSSIFLLLRSMKWSPFQLTYSPAEERWKVYVRSTSLANWSSIRRLAFYKVGLGRLLHILRIDHRNSDFWCHGWLNISTHCPGSSTKRVQFHGAHADAVLWCYATVTGNVAHSNGACSRCLLSNT